MPYKQATTALFASIKLKARADRNRPLDFEKEFDRMLREGSIVRSTDGDDDSILQPAEGNHLPREIARRHVSMLDKIGAGAFGEVWKGVLDDSSRGGVRDYLVAVKTLVRDTEEATSEMLQEAVIMAHIGSHSNVVNLVGAVTAGIPKLLLMSYCEHGSLQSYLRKRSGGGDHQTLTEPEKLKFAHHVAMGMFHLHSKRVVHRDLAARNVLVDSLLVCKVCDFGLSRASHTGDGDDSEDEVYYRANRGTFPVRWTAPEAMESMRFSTATDVWSFGVLLLEIFHDGARPYDEMDNETVISRVLSGYRAARPQNCSTEVYTAIMMPCWNSDHRARPGFSELARNCGVAVSTINSRSLATMKRFQRAPTQRMNRGPLRNAGYDADAYVTLFEAMSAGNQVDYLIVYKSLVANGVLSKNQIQLALVQRPRDIKRQNVRFISQLGSGQFGVVWKAIYTDDRSAEFLVAAKTLSKSTEESVNELLQEAVYVPFCPICANSVFRFVCLVVAFGLLPTYPRWGFVWHCSVVAAAACCIAVCCIWRNVCRRARWCLRLAALVVEGDTHAS